MDSLGYAYDASSKESMVILCSAENNEHSSNYVGQQKLDPKVGSSRGI